MPFNLDCPYIGEAIGEMADMIEDCVAAAPEYNLPAAPAYILQRQFEDIGISYDKFITIAMFMHECGRLIIIDPLLDLGSVSPLGMLVLGPLKVRDFRPRSRLEVS